MRTESYAGKMKMEMEMNGNDLDDFRVEVVEMTMVVSTSGKVEMNGNDHGDFRGK